MKKLFFVEMTDTYGGEANYSWVTRRLVRATTRMGAARKFARHAGLSVHCTGDYGDSARYDSASGATCIADRYMHVETI